MSHIYGGHVQLVRRENSQPGIFKLPPPLMSHYSRLNSGRRSGSVLNPRNDSCGYAYQYEHDEQRNDRPCRFNLIAPVDLRRLLIIVPTPSKVDDRVCQQSAYDYKNYGADDHCQQRKMVDFRRWCAERLEDI